MAEKENCVRVTRAMKRKAEAAAVVEQTPTKKRVVLGELPYLQNAAVPANEGSGVAPQTQKCRNRTRTRAKRALPIPEAAPPTAQEVDTMPLDPQMCEPYARDIYEYLHKLEVLYISLLRNWEIGIVNFDFVNVLVFFF